MFNFHVMDVIIAYFLDLVFGDPYLMPHPVKFIGMLIRSAEGFLRKRLKNEKLGGIVLAVFVVSLVYMLLFIILKLAALIHVALFHMLNIYFIYTALAAKCLAKEAYKVYDVLKKDDLASARRKLSMLVSRQTDCLDKEAMIRGVIETTAENTVDGVVSPLIYSLIGSLFGVGAPLVYLFKASSTLDSMVGYMNEKYKDFGWASAKLDDVLNLVPARISGLMIPFAALILRKNFLRSFVVMIRDRKKHKSPNCAYPEAAVAGALGISLGGSNVYFGEVINKPIIGDADRNIRISDIVDTIKIMYITELLILISFLAAIYFM